MSTFFIQFADVFLHSSWLVWGMMSVVFIGGMLLLVRYWYLSRFFVIRIPEKKKLVMKEKNVFSARAKKKAIDQLPFLLQGLNSGLQSGYSFSQALVFVEAEIPNPLRFFVRNMNQDLQLQKSLEDVLTRFMKDLSHPDIQFLGESLLLQIQSGGDMVALLEQVRFIIEENKKLERDRKSFTSQGKLSGLIIASLWPLSLVFFVFFAPKQTEILFQTSAGIMLLVLAISLECIGFLWIYKIIEIKK